MKNIIIRSFAALSVVLVAAGCIKETFPTGGTITTEQQLASPNALQYMVSGIPAAMMASGTAGYASSYGYHADFGIAGIHLMTECMLEDFTISGDLGYFWFGAFFQNKSMGADYIYNAYFWDCYYAWIKLANDVILMAGEITDETDKTVRSAVGQAYAYRAMCYLDLARLYEPKQNNVVPVPDEVMGLTVPIVKEDITEAEAKNNPRATREELYEFIFSDLAKAEEYLDASANTYSTPSKGAVYGMYARAYQELGGTYHELGDKTKSDANYTKAAEYARKAIETSGRTPLTQAEWLDPKSGFNDGSANNAWMWGLTLSVENASNIITCIAHLASEATWGYSILSLPSINKALYERIEVADFRKKAWLDPDYTWMPGHENYSASAYQFCGKDDPMSGYEQYNIHNGYDYFMNFTAPYVNIKFRPANAQTVEYTEGNVADRVLMRVEEMYFIEIEAALRTKGVGEAQKLLNNFMRTYRYSSYDCSHASSDVAFVQEMLLQKRIEFWGEGILFYDYKRLDQSITRGYSGTNFPAVARFNTDGRSPQWNIVITRVGEIQSNPALEGLNNPDPTGKLTPWTE